MIARKLIQALKAGEVVLKLRFNKYYLFYALALVCLSQASIIIKWSLTEPLVLGSWRLLGAGFILLAWSKVYAPTEEVHSADLRKIVAAGFAFFIHLFSYAYSAHHTSVSHLMLLFSLNPVTTAIGSWIFFKERMTKKQIASYALALIGLYILVREKQGTSEIVGDMMAIVAAITFSAYALLSHWARRHLSNAVFASRMYLAGSCFFFLTTLIWGQTSPIPDNSRGWIGIALLTLFPTLMGHGTFTFCLRHIPLHVLSLGKLLEPGLAAVSAFLIFGESLSAATVISSVLIFASVVLVVKIK